MLLRMFRVFILLGLIAAAVLMVGSLWLYQDRNLVSLAKNVYWEAVAAGEPELSSRMVGHVTTVRAKMNKRVWGGSEVHDVVYKRAARKSGVIVCQFSWTCMSAAKKEPTVKRNWELSMRIARDELAGKFTPPVQLAGATHYLNPRHSARHNVCWFKTSLIELGKAEDASRHVFYREALTEAERKTLPKRATVDECKRQKRKKRVARKK